jgi:hypothetical protein
MLRHLSVSTPRRLASFGFDVVHSQRISRLASSLNSGPSVKARACDSAHARPEQAMPQSLAGSATGRSHALPQEAMLQTHAGSATGVSCDSALAASRCESGGLTTSGSGWACPTRPCDWGEALPNLAMVQGAAPYNPVWWIDGRTRGFQRHQGLCRGFATRTSPRGPSGADEHHTAPRRDAEGLQQGSPSTSSGTPGRRGADELHQGAPLASGRDLGRGDRQGSGADPRPRIPQQRGTTPSGDTTPSGERRGLEWNPRVGQQQGSRPGYPRAGQQDTRAPRQLGSAQRGPPRMARDADGRQEGPGEGYPRMSQQQGFANRRLPGMTQNPNPRDQGLNWEDRGNPRQQGTSRTGVSGEPSRVRDGRVSEGGSRAGSGEAAMEDAQGPIQGTGSPGYPSQAGQRLSKRGHVRTNLPPGEEPPRQASKPISIFPGFSTLHAAGVILHLRGSNVLWGQHLVFRLVRCGKMC